MLNYLNESDLVEKLLYVIAFIYFIFKQITKSTIIFFITKVKRNIKFFILFI